MIAAEILFIALNFAADEVAVNRACHSNTPVRAYKSDQDRVIAGIKSWVIYHLLFDIFHLKKHRVSLVANAKCKMESGR
jgi:hypothetical protein